MTTDCDLKLIRKWFSTKSTISEMFGYHPMSNESQKLCFILEDESRGKQVKIYGNTCIPDGDYFVKITYSQRFKRDLPIIYNREEFNGQPYVITDGVNVWEGVRMHPGNTDADTLGCQLPGMSKGKDIVMDSRVAFDQHLFPFIQNHPALKAQGWLRLKIVHEQIQF